MIGDRYTRQIQTVEDNARVNGPARKMFYTRGGLLGDGCDLFAVKYDPPNKVV
jgi:hypothetical protein